MVLFGVILLLKVVLFLVIMSGCFGNCFESEMSSFLSFFGVMFYFMVV